jgi:hypothetical protein
MKIFYRLNIVLFFIACIFSFSYSGPTSEQLRVYAVRLTERIDVDGKLNESIWKNSSAVTDFFQKEPDQGKPSTEKTSVWVAYDDNALYVAARLYDNHPDSIHALLSRRDNFSTADWFAVFLDPYRDKRSGNYFAVGPAGTICDGVLYNDDWDASDWDGVWEGKASIDKEGWSVEMKIPFSQLRFRDSEIQTWGIDFRRDIGRRNEQDYMVYTPRMQSGFVSRFPELTGIEGVKPSQSIEVLPFITSKLEYSHPSSGDPFNKRERYSPDAGMDLRYGLSSNLTLNATVNPDFGQVEVDPAVVNLSDVESFFQEKRPFFVEGANIFTAFGQGGGRNYWNFNYPSPTFFYSRRIGRTPHGNDTLDNVDYSDSPIATRILGAGKITGKISDSWNVGMIHAVTKSELASFQSTIPIKDSTSATVHSKAEVEPLTYYGVARVQKEFSEGRQGLGIIGTLTLRDFSTDPVGSRLRKAMNQNALFTGIDGWTFLDEEKAWVVTGYTAMSRVEGSRDQMINLQQNSQHYFQRPDASYLKIDSTATSLTGFTGRAYLIKQKGNSYVNASFGIIDPKFEINDLGFLSRTDVINMHGGGGYVWSEPEGIFRVRELGGGVGQSYDFGGNLTNRIIVEWAYAQFINYYNINLNFVQVPSRTFNDRLTRGGPMTINPTGLEFDVNANSDDRKDVYVNVYINTYNSRDTKFFNYGGSLQYRPRPNILVSIGPDFSIDNENVQWVNGGLSNDLSSELYGKHYAFGELKQITMSANIRLNWTFTPTLSLQLFVQPLISSGSYNNFKMLREPKSDNYTVFGTNGTTITRNIESFNNFSYTIDADGIGPIPEYTFDNPDFNFKSLRGNAVLRWEYLPGSTLYLVWTQNRNDNENNGEFQFNHSLTRLGNSQPDNIFLLKFSYYFNM